MAATDTLQEFLINIRYHVDNASQQNFLTGVANSTVKMLGMKTAVVGLTVAMVELTRRIAEAGDQFYWMSMRLGSSVGPIQDTAFALSNLGISSQQALSSMEGFSDWQRANGIAAIGWMRAFGVTATDTTQQMNQLASAFRAMGGTFEFAHGTPEQRQMYMLARARAA